MTGVMNALADAWFHPTDDGRVLYHVGLWSRETLIIDRQDRAVEIRDKVLWWYRAFALFYLTMLAVPFMFPDIVEMLLILFILPAFVRSEEIEPKDLPKSADEVTFGQVCRKLTGSLTYPRLATNLLVALSVMTVCVFLRSFDPTTDVSRGLRGVVFLSGLVSFITISLLVMKFSLQIRPRDQI